MTLYQAMSEKETYLYLDLNGELDVNYFQNNKIFFKMINIDKKPMVQIGNYVFEGKYEDYLGTKLFFVEDQDYEPGGNIFEKQSPIHLKYLVKTAKILQLKWRSLPTTTAEEAKNSDEYMNLRFQEAYNRVLDKFEKAELNINDISMKPKDVDGKLVVATEGTVEENGNDKVLIESINEANKEVPMEVDEAELRDNVGFTKYEVFKSYNQLPKKQVEQLKLYEIKEENLVAVVDASNYPVLKQLFLQNISFEDITLSKDSFEKYVNIEKSVQSGIVPDVTIGELTDDLRNKLLHSDNFDNFTLPMKMAYLLLQLEHYKKSIEEAKNKNALKQVDQFGRTLVDKYRLLKQLMKDLWYIVCLNKPTKS